MRSGDAAQRLNTSMQRLAEARQLRQLRRIARIATAAESPASSVSPVGDIIAQSVMDLAGSDGSLVVWVIHHRHRLTVALHAAPISLCIVPVAFSRLTSSR